MFSRRQRTKQFNNLTLERIDALFEISKIQSIVRILIRFIFESKSSFFQSMSDVQNVVFLSKNVKMIDNVINQNDFSELMKQRLTIIKIEKRRAYLKHRLIQMKTKKKSEYFCNCFWNIEVVLKKCRTLNNFIIEKEIEI